MRGAALLLAAACAGGASRPTARGTVVLDAGDHRIAASMIESVGFWEALIENGDVDGRVLGDHPVDTLLHAVHAEPWDQGVDISVTLPDPQIALRICDGILWAYQRIPDGAAHPQGGCEIVQ